MTTPTREASEVLAVTQADREAAARLIETYWSGNASMLKLAASYRDGHTGGIFARSFARHRIEALASISPTPPAVGEGEADRLAQSVLAIPWLRYSPDDGVSIVPSDLPDQLALATLRPSPNAIREALETCKRGAMAGLSEFSARQGDRRAPIWHSVNALQDHLSCIIGTCDAALATPEGRTTDKGEAA